MLKGSGPRAGDAGAGGGLQVTHFSRIAPGLWQGQRLRRAKGSWSHYYVPPACKLPKRYEKLGPLYGRAAHIVLSSNKKVGIILMFFYTVGCSVFFKSPNQISNPKTKMSPGSL